MTAQAREQDILLKGGLVVDGSGGAPFAANVLVRGGKVYRISPRTIRTTGVVIECGGRVVAPGFIDAHSHLDWHVPIKGHDELKYPFLAQGITTVVAGNCGHSAAGFREASAWKDRIAAVLGAGVLSVQWNTVAEYADRLDASGASQNVALLAGHGSTRASIRGVDPSPLHPYEIKELLWLLEAALDQGARGVSLGLQYQPGMFARPEEIHEVARLVKRKGKVLAVHPRSFTPARRSRPMEALEEALAIGRTTGVRLQVSHLFFAGSRARRSVDTGLAMIDAATREGVDARFDFAPYACEATVIGVLLPAWFVVRGPGAYAEAASLRRLKRDLRAAERQGGFGTADIQVTNTIDPEIAEHNGKFIPDIARIRRMSAVDVLVDIARRSGGQAKVLVHNGGTDRIMESLVRHPASLFMTDAWVEPGGVQNPAAYGAFPRLLQACRERKLLPLEDAVRKMTGATAERFGLAGRGRLAEGAPADITVFDGENVRDMTTPTDTTAAPQGIDYVFVNGKKIVGSGKRESPLNAGVILR